MAKAVEATDIFKLVLFIQTKVANAWNAHEAFLILKAKEQDSGWLLVQRTLLHTSHQVIWIFDYNGLRFTSLYNK